MSPKLARPPRANAHTLSVGPLTNVCTRYLFCTPFISIVVATFIILNFFLMSVGSSGAVPAKTLFGVLAMWLLVSAPLCFFGAYLGFKRTVRTCRPAPSALLRGRTSYNPGGGGGGVDSVGPFQRVEYPVRTNQIPRQIPTQVFYLRPLPSILLGGILPFGAIFIELYFILNSIWFNRWVHTEAQEGGARTVWARQGRLTGWRCWHRSGGTQDLLRVRLFVLGLLDPVPDVCRGDHPALLLPSVR